MIKYKFTTTLLNETVSFYLEVEKHNATLIHQILSHCEHSILEGKATNKQINIFTKDEILSENFERRLLDAKKAMRQKVIIRGDYPELESKLIEASTVAEMFRSGVTEKELIDLRKDEFYRRKNGQA